MPAIAWYIPSIWKCHPYGWYILGISKVLRCISLAIDFTFQRRKLLKSLNSNKPFYRIHPKAKLNASIKLNNKLHRAFLQADKDIKQNEEIFNHYYFDYWFMQEFKEYKGFKKYIDEFYPGNLDLVIDNVNNELIIKLGDDAGVTVTMKHLKDFNIIKYDTSKM